MEVKSIQMMKHNRRPIVQFQAVSSVEEDSTHKVDQVIGRRMPREVSKEEYERVPINQLEKNALLLKAVMMNLMLIVTYLATILPCVGTTLVSKKI
jgi:hypothetical protein